MKDEKNDFPLQMIRITKPSKEDVKYANDLYKKGMVQEEDMRPNMSITTPRQGPENPDEK